MKTRVYLLTVLALLLHGACLQAEDLLIRAAKVYTMTGPPLSPGAVLVSKGKIAQVAGTIEAPAGVKVIDLGKGSLLPGLINAYSQDGIAVSDSEITREITPDFRVLSSIDWRSRDFREALSEGTTTAAVTPGTDAVFAGISCVVKMAGTVPQRILERDAGLVITMASDPGSGNQARSRPDTIYVRQPTNRMGVVWMLRTTFAKAGQGKSPELLTIREALAGQRRIFAVSRTEHDMQALLRTAREFKFAPTIIGGLEAYKMKEDLLAAKASVVLLPLTTSSRVTGAEDSEVIWNQPGILHKAGISFAFSGEHLLEQARFATRFGLPQDVALQAITSTPARLLGVDGRVGTLAPGRDADLVALSGDPFELTSAIQWVLVDGTIHEQGN